jgi:hypothetical protein
VGELIPFPLPNDKLNEEETLEYDELKAALEKATTFCEYRILKKKVAAFKKKVEDRYNKD